MADAARKKASSRATGVRKTRPASSQPRAGPGSGAIKSGMTVEDLKRLTQQRMAGSAQGPSTPRGNPSTPRGAAPTSGGIPQPLHSAPTSGMTVQELKQLTNMRLTSAQAAHQAAMAGYAKHQFRDYMQGPYSPARGFVPGQHPQMPANPMYMPATAAAAAANAEARASAEVQETKKPSGSPSYRIFVPKNPPPPVEKRPLSPRGSQLKGVADMYREGIMSDEEKNRLKDSIIKDSMKDSIPPPPISGGIPVPSWSPPPSNRKSAPGSSTSAPGSSRESANLFYNPGEYEKANNEQNKVVAPPPGMSRRPSMTVPWQVAESVFDTTTGLLDGRNHSPSAGVTSPSNSNGSSLAGGSLSSGGRRGSFGNAAQLFRFRRRSKSRLQFESEGLQSAADNIPEFRMPGIAEGEADSTPEKASNNPFFVTDAADASPFGNRLMMNSGKDNGMEFSFDSSDIFGFGGGVHALNFDSDIDNNNDESSGMLKQEQLPMMSPNGAKLRQVAELARRGSISSEDKTRAKDEIIQQSLGGGNNLALIGKLKLKMSDRLAEARKKIKKKAASGSPPRSPARSPARSQTRSPVSSPSLRPPPGFSSLSSAHSSSGVQRKAPGSGTSERSVKSQGLQHRLEEAAKRVAACVANSNMEEFGQAMAELEQLKKEAQAMIESN